MRERIEPKNEIFYPDAGGYTGFSITTWKVDSDNIGQVSLITRWGGFWPDRFLDASDSRNGDHVLEGRFFVFGGLPMLVVEIGTESEISLLTSGLFEQWKPIMDEIKSGEEKLWQDKSRGGIHVDEVLTSDILEKLNSTHSRNRHKEE